MKTYTIVGIVLAVLIALAVLKPVAQALIEWCAFKTRLCGACLDWRKEVAFMFNKPPGRSFWVCDSCVDKKLGPFARTRMVEKGILVPVEQRIGK